MIVGKKRTPKASKRGSKFFLINDSRMNHLEERGNDTIRAMKKQSNSDSDVKCINVQFYGNIHNS
jgi:hypothetical protein